jgi:hypothetical protein
VGSVPDSIQHRIAEIDVWRRHVDFGSQHVRPVREFAVAHPTQKIEILIYRAVPVGALLSRFGQRASVLSHLVGSETVDVGRTCLDQAFRKAVELLKVIRGKVQVVPPIESKPADIFLDRLDVFGIFRRGIRVVESQMTNAAPVLRGQTEIEADRFGMADMKIAVRFRRKASHDTAAVFPGSTVRRDNLTDEIGCTCSFGHGPSVASWRP